MINKQYGLPTLTDFHTPEQAMPVAEVVSVLQVPAFLCRQTDMIFAGAEACKKFNRELKVKKGQFLSPEETKNIVDKASHFLPKEKILLTERGSSFGYNNLVVDMRSLPIMASTGYPVVFDCTHSVQQPGGLGDKSGGDRKMVPFLSRAAVATGCVSAVFIETHENPDKAPSDGPNMIPLKELRVLISQLNFIHSNVRNFN
jgi:2-dehydro-3-deoxyphosphooctonate aldolase (KDO 8-P synthase)